MAESLTDRSVVRRLLGELDVRPSKRLGQSFLVDPGVPEAIAEAVGAFGPDRIVEIGAGLGAVTEAIASLAPEVIALEVDGRLAEHLSRQFSEEPAVSVLHQDVLEFSLPRSGGRMLVVGSIPYAITAPILQRLIEQRDALVGAVLLTQREVAERVEQSPGRGGSSLGVLVRAYADVERIRRVSRGCFYPRPDVDSLLWSMRFLDAARFKAGAEPFFSLVRAIYGARRKMLRGALRSLGDVETVSRALAEVGIDGTVRGETLGFEELDRLARALEVAGLRGEARESPVQN